MSDKKYRMTQDGVDELKDELQILIDQRLDIAESIKVAREAGDLSENSEYQSARTNMERNEQRISEIEYILKNVELIDNPVSNKTVQLGSTVLLKDDKGQTKEFKLVGTVEADPLNGKISDESPIGQALMGKKEKDQTTLKFGSNEIVYTITKIS